MHPLLERQLRKHFGDQPVPESLRPLLAAVDQAYHHHDEDRGLLERSLEISSEELTERYDRLKEQLAVNEQTSALLHKLAYYDPLTGLLNRRSFEEKLTSLTEHRNADGLLTFLMFLDLDQFKVVNDCCGHRAGDELLCHVAQILLDACQAGDHVYRLGGDEFSLLITTSDASLAQERAEHIRGTVDALRFHWEGEVFRIGVSIGLVPVPDKPEDPQELQQMADAACYAAKESGRNQVHVVDGKTDPAIRSEMRWVQRLRSSMDANAFTLYGQHIFPLQGAAAEETEHVEVLLRLREYAQRKLIPPGAFLPAAERYGLSPELDEWVVGNLIRSIAAQQTVGFDVGRYWVNLSGTSVGDANFAASLIKMVRESPLAPGTLNFEITETAIIRNMRQAVRLIAALKEMGSSFALDDFGSGVSSFDQLKRLRVDYVKIDGRFVRDLVEEKTSRIFVQSIVDIAHALGMQTIAEFVENDAILDLVTEMGVDYGQGYGLHRPEMLFSGPPLALLHEAGALGA